MPGFWLCVAVITVDRSQIIFSLCEAESAPAEDITTQNFILQIQADKHYGASCSSKELIRSERDFIDLLTWGTENETDLFLLMDTNFTPAFYDLSSGLAGTILQKVSNYRVRLAIVGSFEMIASKRFREFMHESNKGSSVRFFQEKARAIDWLLS
jgi:hypothetical protein